MSTTEIKNELQKATGVVQAAEETEQSYLGRIVRKVAALADDEWNALSDAAQAWYNQAVADANDNKPVKGFGDSKPAARARAQPAASSEPVSSEPQVGDTVIMTMADDDKIKGDVVEIDEKNIVLMVDGEEEPYRRAKVKSIKVTKSAGGATSAQAQSEPEPERAPVAGDEVEVTKGDAVYVGKLTEIDSKNAVVEVAGEEEVFRLEKVTIRVLSGGKAPAPTNSTRAQPAASTRAQPTTSKDDKKPEAPKKGVETYRAREIVIENPSADKAAAWKLVVAEFGSEEAVKKVTFDMIYSDTKKTLEILAAKKMLK